MIDDNRVDEIKHRIRRLQDRGNWEDAAKIAFEWFNNNTYWFILLDNHCPECYAEIRQVGYMLECTECKFTQDYV